MSELPQEVHDALEKMKGNIRTLGGIIKGQATTISLLNEKVLALESDNKASKIRKVTGDPENIALALHLLKKKGLSIQAAHDTGVLSYSKTFGVSSWPDEYRDEWLDEHGMVDVYEDPLNNSIKASKIDAFK